MRDSPRRRPLAFEVKPAPPPRDLFDDLPIGVYRVAGDGTFLSANRTALEMLGCPGPGALLGRNAIDLYVDPADRRRLLDQIAASGEARDFETRVRRFDGKTIWVRVSSRQLRAADGSVYYEGALQDLTDRRRMEEALERSERQYRLLFDSNPLPMWVYDRETLRFLAVNHAAVAQYGYSREEFLAMTLRDIRPPDDVDAVVEAAATSVEGLQSSGVWRHRRKDGSLFEVEVTSHSIVFDGRPARLVSPIDVTERRRSRRRIARSEERYRTLFEESKDVVLVTNLEGVILDVNGAGVALFGYPSKEDLVTTRSAFDLWASPAELAAFLLAVEESGLVRDFEADLRRKDGTPIRVLLTATAMRDARGEVSLLRSIVRDITAQRRLEEQLLHAQKLDAIGRLAGGVAHDFNNLLTVIRSATALARIELPEGQEARATLDEIDHAAQRAADLTRQLLAFARRQPANPSVFDLSERVVNLERMLRRVIGENIDLISVPDREAGCIRADPGQIEQVLVNLAVNARDAMPQGGKLFIETAAVTLDAAASPGTSLPAGRYVTLTVRDTGAGLSPEAKAHLFEPFFTTKPVGKGTGLGLATCYGIVSQNGGAIEAESENGRGTIFRVYLPRFEEAAAPEVETGSRPASVGGGTVLVVEDDSLVRGFVVQSLRAFGFSALGSGSGSEALALAGDGTHIDLLLTDLVLPEMPGAEVARRLCERHPLLKVLFMSGYADELSAAGAGSFLQKPFTPEALAARVSEILLGGTLSV